MTSSPPITHQWDFENRLVQAKQPGITMTWSYDALGRRHQRTIQTVISTVRQTFVWDKWNPQQVANNITPRTIVYDVEPFLYGPPQTRRAVSEESFLHFDALESVTQRTGSGGNILEQSRYEGFGTPIQISGATIDLGWVGGMGYYGDGITSATRYIRQRWYRPEFARWMSRDPLGVDYNPFGATAISPPFIITPLIRIGMSRNTFYLFRFRWHSIARGLVGTKMNPFVGSDSVDSLTYRYAWNNGVIFIDAMGEAIIPIGPGDLPTTNPPQHTGALPNCPLNCRKRRPGVEPVPPNGCTSPAKQWVYIPVGGKEYWLELRRCCRVHDYCYQECGQSQRTCDDEFGECLRALCQILRQKMEDDGQSWIDVRLTMQGCNGLASAYEIAVEQFGRQAFDESQFMNCYCSRGF